MGALGSVGPAGVTLLFAIARRARGSCATVRELNLRPPPNAGPAAPCCVSASRHGWLARACAPAPYVGLLKHRESHPECRTPLVSRTFPHIRASQRIV